ncbi:DUF3611 family protein [Leptolyngbya ohadii]|uniref:DUF3611 family protein n=1 Tax=Leptolyngbya ohadii TaxID=1962290 RepID=UPI000B59ED7A|nr:DUF3611 family protein [Leptolyngbya ohadii]
MVTRSNQTGSGNREYFANQLRRAGWIGLVLEAILTTISALILFTAFIDPSFNLNLRSGVSLLSFCASLIVLGGGIYWMFRCTQFAKQLMSGDPASYPKPDRIRHILNRGITLHFIGVFLSLLSAQIIVGDLVLKVLTIPSGGVVYQSRQLLQPLDIFVVQGSILMIAAAFFGLIILFWLLKQLNLHSSRGNRANTEQGV